ncbi:MAG: hypothetical protein HQK53_02550 [Oligoflexia bacterium]|nr:hypothetical protein [Oligoflexia bacterium]
MQLIDFHQYSLRDIDFIPGYTGIIFDLFFRGGRPLPLFINSLLIYFFHLQIHQIKIFYAVINVLFSIVLLKNISKKLRVTTARYLFTLLLLFSNPMYQSIFDNCGTYSLFMILLLFYCDCVMDIFNNKIHYSKIISAWILMCFTSDLSIIVIGISYLLIYKYAYNICKEKAQKLLPLFCILITYLAVAHVKFHFETMYDMQNLSFFSFYDEEKFKIQYFYKMITVLLQYSPNTFLGFVKTDIYWSIIANIVVFYMIFATKKNVKKEFFYYFVLLFVAFLIFIVFIIIVSCFFSISLYLSSLIPLIAVVIAHYPARLKSLPTLFIIVFFVVVPLVFSKDFRPKIIDHVQYVKALHERQKNYQKHYIIPPLGIQVYWNNPNCLEKIPADSQIIYNVAQIKNNNFIIDIIKYSEYGVSFIDYKRYQQRIIGWLKDHHYLLLKEEDYGHYTRLHFILL